jgi:hypothetical protein
VLGCELPDLPLPRWLLFLPPPSWLGLAVGVDDLESLPLTILSFEYGLAGRDDSELSFKYGLAGRDDSSIRYGVVVRVRPCRSRRFELYPWFEYGVAVIRYSSNTSRWLETEYRWFDTELPFDTQAIRVVVLGWSRQYGDVVRVRPCLSISDVVVAYSVHRVAV